MKKIIFNLLFLTIPSFVFAQSISVKVLDKIDSSPIGNIKVESKDKVFFTDENGLILIDKELFPLQYWRPSKDSPDVLQKKLLLLRNT